jgi:hypothetical protein
MEVRAMHLVSEKIEKPEEITLLRQLKISMKLWLAQFLGSNLD